VRPCILPSVIIPTYNRPDQLRNVLRCLASQTEAPHEVMVCDDGSTESLDVLLEEFRNVLPLTYLRQERRGSRAAAARNLGIRRATGDIMIFIDDDIVCPADFVAAHVGAHRQLERERRPRVVLGLRRRIFERPSVLPITKRELRCAEPGRAFTAGLSLLRRRFGQNPWYHAISCNMSVTRLDDGILFDETFEGWGAEDVDFAYRLFRAGYRVLVSPETIVGHIEDPLPRDPFRCEALGLEPRYESYLRNCVRLIRKHAGDREVVALVKRDLSRYVFDTAERRWRRNGTRNDPNDVIARIEMELAG
jgi:glycosyltransferase involved in cell wall biosynthesis